MAAMTTWASPSRDNVGRGCVPREATRPSTAAAHVRRAPMRQPWTTPQTRRPKGRHEIRNATRSSRRIVFGRLLALPSRSPRTARTARSARSARCDRRRARNCVSTVGRKSGRWPARRIASSSWRARTEELCGHGGSHLAGGARDCFGGTRPGRHGAWPEGKDNRNERIRPVATDDCIPARG